MKKLFIVCFDGMIQAFTEDGDRAGSCVAGGFIQDPYEKQKEFIIEIFKKWEEKYSQDYEIVYANSLQKKEDAKEAIKKVIEKEKKYEGKDDYQYKKNSIYWEEWLSLVDTKSFDYYNGDIIQSM